MILVMFGYLNCHSLVLSFCKSTEGGSSDGIRWDQTFGLISFDCWGRTIDELLSLLIVTNTRKE